VLIVIIVVLIVYVTFSKAKTSFTKCLDHNLVRFVCWRTLKVKVLGKEGEISPSCSELFLTNAYTQQQICTFANANAMLIYTIIKSSRSVRGDLKFMRRRVSIRVRKSAG